MRKLDLHPDGGSERGDRTRLRNQMERLFGCSVSLIYEDERGKRFVRSHIAESGMYWWNPKRPDERMLWDSKIRLGEAFFNEIVNHPVPLDMNILRALKRCSLGLDLGTCGWRIPDLAHERGGRATRLEVPNDVIQTLRSFRLIRNPLSKKSSYAESSLIGAAQAAPRLHPLRSGGPTCRGQ